MTDISAGRKLRKLCSGSQPLQVAGTVNAYCALLAQQAGFNTIYLSGAGVANASYGLPDLGFTSREDVLIDIKRITATTELPLLVDADTGWGDCSETARQFCDAGAAGIHIEDQVELKRCGHRPGKKLVATEEMQDRIRAACSGRTDPEFVIMARTDAHAVEGFDAAITRAQAYVDAGADMVFAEAFATLEEYKRFCDAVKAPVLANITEFGKTPLFTVNELGETGIKLVLYPLSAFRAMSAIALQTYQTILQDGSQQAMIGQMQTRKELYKILNYEKYEQEFDEKLNSKK